MQSALRGHWRETKDDSHENVNGANAVAFTAGFVGVLGACGQYANHAGKLATHTMRRSYRSWLDAVGTPITVQHKPMIIPVFMLAFNDFL
jgi:hypothetical protein